MRNFLFLLSREIIVFVFNVFLVSFFEIKRRGDLIGEYIVVVFIILLCVIFFVIGYLYVFN